MTLWASPAMASSFISKGDPVAQAKANVALAKKQAADAAGKYSDAYSALSQIDDELADTQEKLSSAETNIATLHAKASSQAKDAYIRSSSESKNKSYSDEVDSSRHDQFLATVSQFDDAQLTNLVGMQEDLRISKENLLNLQKDRKETVATLAAQKKSLDAKLANATKAQNELEAKIARDAKARKAAAKKAGSKSSTASGTIISTSNGPLVCPVAGGTAFTNDWGQPRSGGRTHKGTDIFAARGTPDVAVVAGTVFFQVEGTGGISAYVTGGGNTYYYTHLQNTVGSARTVSKGEVIGHVGSSGNADGGATHTHFEIRIGGPNGTRVNPYPTLSRIC